MPAGRLAAIGVTNQRETTIVWERATGRPVHNAIVWQSRVTAALLRRAAGAGPGAARPGAHGPAARRLLQRPQDPPRPGVASPGLQARAERGELLFGTVDTFLIWRLTGGALHVTDVSNASRTLLFDIHRLAWDEELLAAMDIPAAMLPVGAAQLGRLRHDGGRAARRQRDHRRRRRRPAGGDVRPGLLHARHGQADVRHGRLPAAQHGRSGRGQSTRPADHRRLAARRDKVTYALEGSVFVAGAGVQWLRDGLGLISDTAEVERLAGQVADTDGVYVVPAFVGPGGALLGPVCAGHRSSA